MDASRVEQSLDSLWFYANILTSTPHSVPSLTHQFPPSSAFEEPRSMPERETEKRDRRKRRKWKKATNVMIHGGFDVKKISGFLKFEEESYKYHILTGKMPSFDDDVAMKQHLKAWAYAVACTIK
ncbi:hypothetical protein VNO77_01145 [Canavalia gladiata]|uniref:Uncharacterized protein n=1 Tax=Canavalia gladiata TaxID=3824 RepID=A0AAN9R1Y4_CANGL